MHELTEAQEMSTALQSSPSLLHVISPHLDLLAFTLCPPCPPTSAVSLDGLPPPSTLSSLALCPSLVVPLRSLVSDCSVQPFTHLVTPKASKKPVGPVIQLCAWLRATPQLQGTHPGPESIGPSEPAAFTGFCGSYGHRIFLADPWGGEEKEAASGNK